MNWISVKDSLPDDEDVILIKSNWYEPFLCVAKFMSNYSTLEEDYNNIFLVISHPKIFKLFGHFPEYKKSEIIKKSKVDEWMAIPGISLSKTEPPKDNP